MARNTAWTEDGSGEYPSIGFEQGCAPKSTGQHGLSDCQAGCLRGSVCRTRKFIGFAINHQPSTTSDSQPSTLNFSEMAALRGGWNWRGVFDNATAEGVSSVRPFS
jgi:hypothetical protein